MHSSIKVKQGVGLAVTGDLRKGVSRLSILAWQGVCGCQARKAAAVGVDFPEAILAKIPSQPYPPPLAPTASGST
ncbi:MAG TPA: hypothetical protein VFB60_08300 [Ktedonobacteraceae bacterium]|nr:hypothetical protein [Ktedonobacteraceae bacterium]